MNSICGADCNNCGYGKSLGCGGCESSGGCPFGKQCFIASHIKAEGMAGFDVLKERLMAELNKLNVDGMPKITELYALNGAYINLAYPLPNGCSVKLLDDSEIYLGTQVERTCGGDSEGRYFGLVAGTDFLLVSEYGVNGSDPEIVLFKKSRLPNTGAKPPLCGKTEHNE